MRSANKYVALFVIFTFLATGVAGGISFIYSAAEFRSNTQEALKESAVSYAHELDSLIYSIEVAVDTSTSYLATWVEPRDLSQTTPYSALEFKLKQLGSALQQTDIPATSFYVRFDPEISSGTSGIFFADTDGDGLLEDLPPTDISAFDPSDRERVGWFYEPMTFSRGQWMKPYYNANIDTYMVSYVAPIFVAGKAIGIVGIDMDFKTLKAIADSHLGAGKVVILDRDYAFMVHDTFSYQDRLDTIDKGDLSYMVYLVASQREGFIRYTLSGAPKVLGFSKLANDWTVMVHLTEEEAFEEFYKTTSRLVWINGSVSVLLSGLALLFGAYVNKLYAKNFSLEQEVAQRNQQLTQINVNLEKTVAELELSLTQQQEMQDRLIESEKLAALGDLVAGVAHELNTPLGNAITLNSYLTSQIKQLQHLYKGHQLTQAQLEEALETVYDSSQLTEKTLQRISGLIEHFKLVANVHHLMDIRRLNFYDFLVDTCHLFNERLEKSGAKLTIEGDPLVEVLTSPTIIGQVLYQLVNNSLLHGFEDRNGGTITIAYAILQEGQIHCDHLEASRILMLRISDNGCGIPSELKPKIFNPFVSTKKNKGAVGLGLHMVHNLITQSLKGCIALDPDWVHGTCFVVEVPIDHKA